MPTLDDPATLLAAWESAAAVPLVARGAVLVAHTELTGDIEAALDLPIAACAELAAHTYLASFGETIEATLRCDNCGEQCELEINMSELAHFEHDSPDGERAASAQFGPFTVRPPSTRDLVALIDDPDSAAALLGRCVRREDDTPVRVDELTATEAAALGQAAEELAGAAAITIRTTCPSCGAEQGRGLDPGGLLWQRTARAAADSLQDVAALASAFGWSEDAVLSLSPTRRRAYLDLATR